MILVNFADLRFTCRLILVDKSCAIKSTNTLHLQGPNMLERLYLPISFSIYVMTKSSITLFHLRIFTRFAAFNTNDDSNGNLREKSQCRVRAQYKRTLIGAAAATTDSLARS
jgi:hypothetical protein